MKGFEVQTIKKVFMVINRPLKRLLTVYGQRIMPVDPHVKGQGLKAKRPSGKI